jgi:DNA repair exonuclease SbcCD nuclease subunit
MKIAHLSDTHLGFRQFSRTTPQGVNQREVDVMLSFRAVLSGILAAAPDMVIHAGDFFHMVKPSNHTIAEAHAAITEFQRARNGAPFVLVGGNHDTPKTADVGNIQHHIARIEGVRFAPTLAKVIDLPEIDTEILCVPSNSLVTREEVVMRPTLGRRYSVLAVHGMARQALPTAVAPIHADFDVDDLHPESFTYVALGDYHNFARYAANCCFSGSTDYTTTNIWDELDHPKGWVSFDTDSGVLKHHAVPTRQAIDLPVIDAADLSVDELIAAMRAATAGLECMPIVRQRVDNLNPIDRRALFQTSLVRELNSRRLNYQVKTAAPTRDRGTGTITSEARTVTTLEETWREHALDAKLPAGIERLAFIQAGIELLQEATAL